MEGGYVFGVGEGARGMERRLGMEFGSGAEGKKRTTAVENDRYYIILYIYIEIITLWKYIM